MSSGRKGSLILGLLVFMGTALPLQVSGAAPDSARRHLDQGWTAADRQEFYHLSPGTQLLPYDWFIALETTRGTQRFKEMVDVFWLLPDRNPASNADLLPVGLGVTSGGSPQRRHLGVTCAFCHTGEIRYRTHRIRIDGAPSMQYNARFFQSLLASLGATYQDDRKLGRFASRVLGPDSGKDAEKRLAMKGDLGRYIANMTQRSTQDPSPVGWGFGRFDALGRGANLVFGQLDFDNLRPANAPVSIPALWSSWEYDWVQWNGAIQHPLARNIAQVIGVNANLFTNPTDPFMPFVDPSDRYRSSVDVKSLLRLEELVRKLKAPQWPKEFPAIDMTLAARGKELYHGDEAKGLKNLCAHCHVATPTQANAHGQHLHVHMIPQPEVGTDAMQAANFKARSAGTGPLQEVLGKDRLPAKDAIQLVTTEIMKRGGVPIDGDNEIRAELEYIARPHVGVWATPPYLHNGSVPNVYELLSPWEQRHRCFYLDPTLEYDPKRLGFAVRECDGRWNPNDPSSGFEFETVRSGNSNRGHEFRNTPKCALDEKEPGILGCELTHEHRMAIIEYLKTL